MRLGVLFGLRLGDLDDDRSLLEKGGGSRIGLVATRVAHDGTANAAHAQGAARGKGKAAEGGDDGGLRAFDCAHGGLRGDGCDSEQRDGEGGTNGSGAQKTSYHSNASYGTLPTGAQRLSDCARLSFLQRH
jgi:hypothetical protein